MPLALEELVIEFCAQYPVQTVDPRVTVTFIQSITKN